MFQGFMPSSIACSRVLTLRVQVPNKVILIVVHLEESGGILSTWASSVIGSGAGVRHVLWESLFFLRTPQCASLQREGVHELTWHPKRDLTKPM